MKRFFLFFLLMISVSCVLAARPTVFSKYGKVSASDFAATIYDGLGYDAVILQNETNCYFDEYNGNLRFHHLRHIRLKVLKDGFVDQDFFTVRFSGRFEYEKVHSNRASVFSLNGNKVVQRKLRYRNFTTHQRDSLESWQDIDLGYLRSGDIVDWEFTVVTFDFQMPPIWRSQSKYPCLVSGLVTHFPHFMQYRYDLRGDDTLKIHHTSCGSFFNMSYSYTPQNNPASIYYMQGRTRQLHVNYKFISNVDTFLVYNSLPLDTISADAHNILYGNAAVRMKASKFTQDIGYHDIYFTAWQQLTHLIYLYADPDNRYLCQNELWFKPYHSGYVIVDSKNWARFHKRLWKSPDFWKPLLKTFQYPDKLSYLLDPDADPDTLKTMKAVYDYVADNMKWNHLRYNHLTRSLEQIRKSGEGNSADINMLLTAMLRHYGVDAFPVLSATRNFGDVDSSYANMQQFNNILACVRLNKLSADGRETFYLLDATSPGGNPWILPDIDFNNMALAVDPDSCYFLEFDADTDNTYNAKKISTSD